MSTVKLIAKKKATRKDGTTPIYLQYCYNSEIRTLINTGYYIDPKHWNYEKDIVRKNYPDFETLNGELDNKLNRLKNIILDAKKDGVDPTIDYAKNRFENPMVKVGLEFFEQLDDFINSRDGKVSKDTIKDYNSLKKHLKKYSEHTKDDVTFKKMNLKFYNSFVNYLRYNSVKPDKTKGQRDNTIGKQIKNLKIFLRDRMDQGIIQLINLKPFVTITEVTDAIYLSEEELKTIYELDLSENETLEQIRDLLIVGCFTGLRYGDLNKLKPEHIDKENGLIQIRQGKVQRNVIIPLIDYVPAIMEKYNYDLPKINLNEFNKEIKQICKKAKLHKKILLTWKKGPDEKIEKVFEKWELATSHVCRRSFCANMFLSGVPAEELMKISGHKNSDSFLRYIKIDNLQAANRLKDFRNKTKK